MQVDAGQVLWRSGDPSDSFYIVINGRLRDLLEKEAGGVRIVGEYGQGMPSSANGFIGCTEDRIFR
jgi:CRP-like cAMP-binding protein